MSEIDAQDQIYCPFCGNETKVHDLGRIGLSPEKLAKLEEHIQNGTLGEILTIADTILQRLDPTSTSIELSTVKTLEAYQERSSKKFDEITKLIWKLNEHVTGRPKGDVAEMIVSEQLTQHFTDDEFSRTKADKAGTDIVAIIDKQNEIGKISISVKNTAKWSYKFTEQLDKNMSQDNTKFGILVSQTLPKGTPTTGQIFHSNGFTYCIVHPKYVLPIYVLFRELIIRLAQNQQYLEDREKEIIKLGKVSSSLARWVDGREYKEILYTLDAIDQSRKDVDDLEDKLENYVISHGKKIKSQTTKIHQKLMNASGFLSNLESILKGKSP